MKLEKSSWRKWARESVRGSDSFAFELFADELLRTPTEVRILKVILGQDGGIPTHFYSIEAHDTARHRIHSVAHSDRRGSSVEEFGWSSKPEYPPKMWISVEWWPIEGWRSWTSEIRFLIRISFIRTGICKDRSLIQSENFFVSISSTLLRQLLLEHN